MPSDKPASLEEIQASIAKLRVTEQQLESTAQKYENKMQSSRKWNYLAVAMAVVVCAVAWINHTSPWLRWGVLPVVLFMVLFYEGMRRLVERADDDFTIAGMDAVDQGPRGQNEAGLDLQQGRHIV